MQMLQKQKTLEFSPTLNTVLMVENTLKNMNESVITIAKLKKILPKKVNHNMLKIILQYLEDSGKILVGLKGITWIYRSPSELKKLKQDGLEL